MDETKEVNTRNIIFFDAKNPISIITNLKN